MPIHIALFIRVVTRKSDELYFKLLIIYSKQTVFFTDPYLTYTKPKTKTTCLNAWLAELRSGLDGVKAFGTWGF